MIAVLVAASVWLGCPAGAAGPAPEDLFSEATAAYQAGDFVKAAARLEPFRGKYADHRLAWPANLLWARCTTDPAESERRFRLLAKTAPPETRKECDLEVASLLLLRERWKDAERAYAAYLDANAGDERAEEAVYWRAVCLRSLGRDAEALGLAEGERRNGRQDRWKALAGLLAGTIRLAAKDLPGANAIYVDLAGAAWGQDVKPQALLGAAKSTKNAAECNRYARAVIDGWPDSPEAAEARGLIHEKAPPDRPYAVRVGAFAQPGNAAAERKKWKQRGKQVVVLKRHHETFGELFFVFLGPYPTKAKAELVAKELKADGVSCGVTPF
ncbi:MAG: SPOR domain-containing protein [Candidatus Coatesbacteria bacterium]